MSFVVECLGAMRERRRGATLNVEDLGSAGGGNLAVFWHHLVSTAFEFDWQWPSHFVNADILIYCWSQQLRSSYHATKNSPDCQQSFLEIIKLECWCGGFNLELATCSLVAKGQWLSVLRGFTAGSKENVKLQPNLVFTAWEIDGLYLYVDSTNKLKMQFNETTKSKQINAMYKAFFCPCIIGFV